MKGLVKCIIAGVIVAVIGAALFITGFALNGWDFKANVEFTMMSYTAQQDNTALDIDIEAGTFITQFYDGDKIYVEYPVAERYKTTVTEENGTLCLNTDNLFHFMFGNINIPETVVKLPKNTVYDLKLEMDAGTAKIAEGKYGKFELDMSAGTFVNDGIECSSLSIEASAGTISAGTVVCDTLNVKMSAGTFKINDLTCRKTDIKASAGTIKLGFTGNREEYGITANVSAGSCNVSSQSGNTDKTINVNISAGTVKLNFGV